MWKFVKNKKKELRREFKQFSKYLQYRKSMDKTKMKKELIIQETP